MKNVALITGIAGQDGSYLSEHLIDRGYEVHGVVRRQSTAENQESRLDHLSGQVTTHYGDLLDVPSLTRIFLETKPTHIFNLGAMSHVRISFDVPSFTIQTNSIKHPHLRCLVTVLMKTDSKERPQDLIL